MDKLYTKSKMVHIIPFDLGKKLDQKDIAKLTKDLNRYDDIGISSQHEAVSVSPNSNFDSQDIIDFWQSISLGVIIGKCIQSGFYMFIYSFGIGVFVIEEPNPIDIRNEDNCTNYSKFRQNIHEDIYNGTHPYSSAISSLLTLLSKDIANTSRRKTFCGNSGIKKVNGLYYVMSIDFIETNKSFDEYTDYDYINFYNFINLKSEKFKNSVFDIESNKIFDINNAKNTFNQGVKFDDDTLVCSSWTSVTICEKKINSDLDFLFILLQIELQAFWFYSYALGKDEYKLHSFREISFLKSTLYEYNLLEAHFNKFSLELLPSYIIDFWNTQTKYSRIDNIIADSKTTILHMIDLAQNKATEKQSFYMKLSSIFMFAIAYFQIIPIVNQISTNSFIINPPTVISFIIGGIAIVLMILFQE